MRYLALGAVCGAIACGTPQDKFVPDYADSWCQYLLDCGDPAELTFEGIGTTEDCLAIYGPEIQTQGAGCKYHGGAAHDCLKTMELLSCPADLSVALEDNLPLACTQVYTECAAVATGDPEPITTTK